ncbi:16S rRNA (uracil(1498)-N(3))-methyltransferase [candidate division GN15 bacterium]|uniref:Ribosomal RNA small subunit methyltransferase E n=1 Tax=candidate division GN15 bacterium TaxID=2072418 RepID=A0A855X4U7_9BACT|nr:MAG: 16S rRNA (uracil(1498)-N(3))-methyltransferase [candidate division GN15 bacterium]
MEPPIFFAPSHSIHDDQIQLPANETHHACEVLRLRSGALVIVVDGLGTAYRGELKIESTKSAMVSVHAHIRNFGEPDCRLTLAAGLSVGFKFDEVVDKGTQLGVSRFVPLITEKSKVKLEDARRIALKTARLEKVALAAMKQCRRSLRPEIATPTTFAQYLSQIDRDSFKLIFHPTEGARALADVFPSEIPKRVTLMVGPEAGFSAGEVNRASAKGFTSVSLGPRVLRTETAGAVVCALVMAHFGELR